jgi:hypothetical protein
MRGGKRGVVDPGDIAIPPAAEDGVDPNPFVA